MTLVRSLAAHAAAISLVAGAAHATWSIVLIDTRTGEVVLGSATCLANFNLQDNTPVLIPGVGGATAQSAVDQNGFNRVFIRDRLLEGVPTDHILELLADFDGGHQNRQYGMGDTAGSISTFTGSGAGDWAGGVTGRVGDVVYAVQGNVLAGEPVVAETETVIVTALNAGLDLPETLMLGMEEAHRWGGDGRCSCSGGNPDGCGSPPDGWDPNTEKSAHIAYMLSARLGDGFGCNAVYRAGRNATGVVSGDFNADGLPDVAAACRSDASVAVLLNRPLSPHYISFAPAEQYGTFSDPTGIDAADFNRDQVLDLIATEAGDGTISVLRGVGDGTFGFPTLIAGRVGASWVKAADLNADNWPDAVVSNLADASITVLLNDGAGSLSVDATIPAGAGPGGLALADIDGDLDLDAVVADQNGAAVLVMTNDGNASFTLARTIPVGARPLQATCGDFDADGRVDIATANRDARSVTVLRQTAPDAFERTDYADNRSYTAVETIRNTPDAPDVLVAGDDTTGGALIFLGRRDAPPEPFHTYKIFPRAMNDITVADFNADGRPDLVTNARTAGGIVALTSLPPGASDLYNDGEGCATADYFLEFNIANQRATDPDPTLQLRALFDPWRNDLMGVTDAVRSTALPDAQRLPVGSQTTLRIQLLDWRQLFVGPGQAVDVEHAPDSAGLTQIGTLTALGDGAFEVQLSALALPDDSRGIDRLRIKVQDAGRVVYLMPDAQVRVVGSLADWNEDGVVDPADLSAFIADWKAKAPDTDLDADGDSDSRDIVLYLRSWAGQ